MDQVAASKRASVVRAHVAIVADDGVLYSRLLQYEVGCAKVGEWVILVFRRLPDAEQWLGATWGRTFHVS